MNKNEFDQKKGEKSSLSDMINEYESDNALRDKIEAAKKRKEMEEEARKQAEIQFRLDEIQREKDKQKLQDSLSQPKKPFLNADAGATQVFSSESVKPLADEDKTLVIMNNMKQRDFSAEANGTNSMNAKISETESERLAPEFEVEGETITEKDIEEYLPKDSKKTKKPSNPDKMNKIITYTIAGITGLCVIGLIVFALNFFGIFGSGSSTEKLKLDEVTVDEKVNLEQVGANHFSIKDSEVKSVTDATLIKLASAEATSTEDGTKVQITDVDKTALAETKGTYSVSFSTRKGTKVTVKATVTETKKVEDPKEEPAKDNSAKITEIKEQIKINTDQIARLEADNATFKNTIATSNEAKAKVDNGYAEQVQAANRELQTAQTAFDSVKTAYDAAVASKDEAKIKKAEEDLAKADKVLKDASKKVSDLNTEIVNKKAAIDVEIETANGTISANEATIKELQSQIISLQNQLSELK